MKSFLSDNTIKNIVNEEQNEEGKIKSFKFLLDKEYDDKKIKLPKKKFVVDIKSDLDIAISKFGKVKGQKSFRESLFLDPLYVNFFK